MSVQNVNVIDQPASSSNLIMAVYDTTTQNYGIQVDLISAFNLGSLQNDILIKQLYVWFNTPLANVLTWSRLNLNSNNMFNVPFPPQNTSSTAGASQSNGYALFTDIYVPLSTLQISNGLLLQPVFGGTGLTTYEVAMQIQYEEVING